MFFFSSLSNWSARSQLVRDAPTSYVEGRARETPQEYAARRAAANRALAHFRDGDANLDLVDEFMYYSQSQSGDDAAAAAAAAAADDEGEDDGGGGGMRAQSTDPQQRRMRTGKGGRPTWAGDVPARNLMNADNGPSPAWNAPTVALPVGSDLRRKVRPSTHHLHTY